MDNTKLGPTISVSWFPYLWKIYWLKIKRCAFIETFKLQENILPKDKAKYPQGWSLFSQLASAAKGMLHTKYLGRVTEYCERPIMGKCPCDESIQLRVDLTSPLSSSTISCHSLSSD
ncbi:unnamed protein product [Boreogadus saida]